MSFRNKDKDNIHKYFKTSSNITGLPRISNVFDIEPIKKSSTLINKININKTPKNKNINFDKKEKINLVIRLMEEPLTKLPFDGFAILSKKYTTEYLLHKSCEKEQKAIFEKNKLFKNNFPLIEILSNRKMKNKNKKMLIQMLTTGYGELTESQKQAIKSEIYKSRLNKKNFNKKENIFSRKNSQKNSQKSLKITKLNQNKDFFTPNRNDINNYISINKNTKTLTQSNFFNNKVLNNNRILGKSLKEFKERKNNRSETEGIYLNLGLGETVRLYNHKANRKNNDILLERFIRKTFLNNKNNEKDFIKNEIINDISKLKFKNRIMPLNTQIVNI